MKLRKSNLDEQQERKLLEIESRGCWLAFWGLLLALIAESIVIKDPYAIIGEWILFMGLALFLGISCGRAGIWDRRMDMSPKTSLLVALAAALCAAVFMFGFTYVRYQKLIGSLSSAAIMGGITFAVCFLILRIAARATKKRQDELNAEPDDETDKMDSH